MECPSCKANILESGRFCDECGVLLATGCPSCGTANRPGAKFCSKCGTNLSAALPIAASPMPLPIMTPSAALRPSPPTSWAERRQLTVMFCDLVGSTALSARLDPEDLGDVIGTYHKCVDEVVGRYAGFVARYMGDGVLVYFGYPQAHEDDAERAVRVGLDLITAVSSLKPFTDTTLQCRVGLATGLVIVGDLIGKGDAQEHGIVGETPNLAARLQAHAQPNEVVLDQRTRLLVGNLFEYQDLGPVQVKGIAEPVQTWRALWPSSVKSRFEAFHATTQIPLVGREEEIELLLRRWERAKAGNGQVVLLAGESGIGKSRIATALQEMLEDESHATLSWFCSPYRQDSALHPMISHLEYAARFDRDDRAEQKLDKLKTALALPSVHTQDLTLLAELLSIPTGGQYPPLTLTPHQKKEKTLEALLRQIELRARKQPVLMVYEDAHWSDPTSCELLDLIVSRVANLPVLLLITFRPEFQPPWSGAAHVTTMMLNRLDRRESSALVQRIVTNSILSDEVVAEILERTEGIPLFIEELTKTMLEGAGDTRGSALAVPSSLQASLLARLDRLPAAKHVAQIGSVIGREFSHELLAEVAEGTLLQGLDELVLAGLAFRRGIPPNATYMFKHVLVQETAYNTLLRRRRQELHARVATVLEESNPEIVEQQPELLAHHCTHAGLIEKAIAYLSRAGRQSLARSATAEAVAQLRKGLELLPGLPDGPDRWKRELELQSALGAALVASQGNSAPITGQAYIRARELCERLGDIDTMVPVLSGLSTYHQTRSEYGAMRSIADDLLRLGRQQNHTAGLLVGNRSMGLCLHHLGSFTSAQIHFQEVNKLYVADTHSSLASVAAFDMRAVALTYLSLTSFILGDVEKAESLSAQALTWSRNLRHPHNLAFALCYAALLKMLRQSDPEAKELLDELITLTTEHHFPAYLAVANVLRGRLLCARGRAADGLVVMRKGLSEIASAGASWNQTYFFGLLALSCENAGLADDAFDALARALEHADKTDERWFEAELHRQKGEWLIAHRPELEEEAEACFHRAIAVAQKQQAKLWELRAATSLARLWRDKYRQKEARDFLAPICNWFSKGTDTPDLDRAKVLLGELTE
jgi:predicted ATPase/class 3 adenylate cyclase